MEPAVHQILINDIETMITDKGGIDETLAKSYRKQAESLIEDQQDHPLKADLSSSLEKLRERIHQQVEKRDRDYEKVITELEAATQALEGEKLKVAEDATHRALSIAGQIHGLSAQRHAEVNKRLDKIYPRMRRLSAWRHWGTTQARQDLIDQIKQIPGSRMDPNQIVKTLRNAKAQWQDWEKSGDHSEHALWKEFSAACDTAYEPCREFFKKQKEERKKNLADKRQLIEEINARYEATDWSQPQWKEVDKWLRQARGRFYKIGHTDYKHHKKLKSSLQQALDQFETHLSRDRERSLKARRELISDIEALAEKDDIREAINTLEQLKKQWVITVLEKRGVENKLWDSYQKALDAVYDKRKAERQEQDQVRNDNLKQKRRVIESLSKASGAATGELLAGQSVLEQHRDQFDAIGYVPRKAEKAMMESWRKAQKQFSEALKKARKSRARDNQNALLEKARFCAALEQRLLQGESIDKEQEEAAYGALPPLSDELEASMRMRKDAALDDSTYSEQTVRSNTEEQLTRCMKCEVILDLPTPADFAQQRMAFQIERLSASMKKNTQGQENLPDLKRQLLTTGAIEADQFATIWARIDAILNC